MNEIERNTDKKHLLIAEIMGGVLVTVPSAIAIILILVSLINK